MHSLALLSLTLALIALHPPAWLGLWQVYRPEGGGGALGLPALWLRRRITLLLRVEVALYLALFGVALAAKGPLHIPLLIFLAASHVLAFIANERSRPFDDSAAEGSRPGRLKGTLRAIFVFDAAEVAILLYFMFLLRPAL